MIKAKLSIFIDTPIQGIPNPLSLNLGLSEGQLENLDGSILGVIAPSVSAYPSVIKLLGINATARIELPSERRFGQWRVAIQSIDIQDSTLVLAITNTAPDHRSITPPVFGIYDPEELN